MSPRRPGEDDLEMVADHFTPDPGQPVTQTTIPGLLFAEVAVHHDNRGWFKENWRSGGPVAAGPPDFRPVQHNISFNVRRGVTRGIHAEPWDKQLSVACGRIFGAWVDLREGPTFGQVCTSELDPSTTVYVPRGVGNAFQALEDNTVYSYLVNGHWNQAAHYPAVDLADTDLLIQWPIPLQDAELSAKDRANPSLVDVTPMAPRRTLIVGGDGQLGRALRAALPGAEWLSREQFDVANTRSYEGRDWSQYRAIVNAAAYTAVDAAESVRGRLEAWRTNAEAALLLSRVATANDLTFVQISSDYVFDGTRAPHLEHEAFSPLGVYGQSKAAGDVAAACTPKHLIVRTSWLIGDGRNFVRTMVDLATGNVSPSVVDDQIGRPTFATDLAAAIRFLLDNDAPYGTYNVTNDGEAASWAEIARAVFVHLGRSADAIRPAVSSTGGNLAPRPLLSELSLDKIKSVGHTPRDWRTALDEYLAPIVAADRV